MKYFKYIITSIFLINAFIFAQNRKSEAFQKPPFLRKPPIFKPKYKSYPLLAGYLLLKEARNGDPFAQHELALRYLMGRGFPKDTARAIFWMKKAADKNLTIANFNYGIMLINGIGVKWNPFKAFTRFEAAAKAGMPKAEYVYATFFLDNLVVSRNLNLAYDWLKLASENKVKNATKLLKQLEQRGITGTGNSPEKKLNSPSIKVLPTNNKGEILNDNWELSYIPFQKDSVGNYQANELRKIFKNNKNELSHKLGIEIDSSLKATQNIDSLIAEAISYGSPNAFKLQGKRFEYGLNKTPDTLKAVFNYIRAVRLNEEENVANIFRLTKSEKFFSRLKQLVNKNNPTAQYVWAELTAMDLDFQMTKKQAFKLLEKSAKNNFIPALIDIGIAYYNGKIVPKNPNKANEFWLKAARLGNKEAEVHIAIAVIFSRKKKNFAKEITFLKNASEHGSVLALNALGYIYEHGLGVKINLARADYYYRKASSLGSSSAFYSLKKLYDSIRPANKKFKIYFAN